MSDMMYIIFSWILFIKVSAESNIANEAIHYFNDGTMVSFADKWELYRAPIENAIETTLKETFDNPGLNVLDRKDALNISDGFLVYDNIVHVLFKDMYLSRLPRLENPRVVLSLASNVLQVEAGVTKMFVQTNYQLFRNVSDVVYSSKDAVNYTSPFSLQQVQNNGEATIIAEHCNLAGFELATLLGESVNLGQDNFKLNSCKFSVEISNPSLGSPPLIVSYFAGELGLKLENILTKPLQEQLAAKLKDAVFSYVNTSSIFGNILPGVRNLQQKLFKKTSAYTTEVIRNLNRLTVEENAASGVLDNVEIKWTDEYDGKPHTSILTLTHMVISGLDTAYSAHTGGVYKFDSVKIYEAIRFSAFQVRGSGSLKIDTDEQLFVFSSEVQDYICHMSLPVNMAERSRRKRNQTGFTLDPRGWRSLEIFGTHSIFWNSLISGVFFNRLPEIITTHINKYFNKAASNVGSKTVMNFNMLEKSDVSSSADNKLQIETDKPNEKDIIGKSDNGWDSDENNNNHDGHDTINDTNEAIQSGDTTQRESENEKHNTSGNEQDIESSHNIEPNQMIETPNKSETNYLSKDEESDSEQHNDAESSNEGYNKVSSCENGKNGNMESSSQNIENNQEIETPEKSQSKYLLKDEGADSKHIDDTEFSNEGYNKISSCEKENGDSNQEQSVNDSDSNSKERRKLYDRRNSAQRRTARISDNEIHSN